MTREPLPSPPTLTRRSPFMADTFSRSFSFEPVGRRIRGTVGAVSVVDSEQAMLLWEPGGVVPGYIFPRQDVRVDLLAPAPRPVHTRHPQAAQWYHLNVPAAWGSVCHLESVAFSYDIEGLEDYLSFDWFQREMPGIEHWYEEDEEIYAHPRDPFKRVDAVPSSRHVEVFLEGVKLADSRRPMLLFETGLPARYYLPPGDVDRSRMVQTPHSTRCPYKGEAQYWSFRLGSQTYENLLWAYPHPLPGVEGIAGLLSFYNEAVDIVVDGERQERPHTIFSRT